MGFLKQILNPFVEFDEDKKDELVRETKPVLPNPPSPQQPVPAATQISAPPTDVNATHPLIKSAGSVNPPTQVPVYSQSGTIAGPSPEDDQYFESLIIDANAKNPLFQGTDLKEFVDSKLDIDDIQDEAIKYRTAFNVFKSTGLTKEKLLSTGQEYLSMIGRDMNAFQSAHALKYQKEVKLKEQQIQKKAEELQQLTQKINVLKSEINQLTQDINLTKENLGTIKASYLLAGEKKQKEIDAELQKINQYF